MTSNDKESSHFEMLTFSILTMQSHYSFVGVFVNFLVGVVGINATRTFEAEITIWCHKGFAMGTLLGSVHLGESRIERESPELDSCFHVFKSFTVTMFIVQSSDSSLKRNGT